jgi:hypothetical protein
MRTIRQCDEKWGVASDSRVTTSFSAGHSESSLGDRPVGGFPTLSEVSLSKSSRDPLSRRDFLLSIAGVVTVSGAGGCKLVLGDKVPAEHLGPARKLRNDLRAVADDVGAFRTRQVYCQTRPEAPFCLQEGDDRCLKKLMQDFSQLRKDYSDLAKGLSMERVGLPGSREAEQSFTEFQGILEELNAHPLESYQEGVATYRGRFYSRAEISKLENLEQFSRSLAFKMVPHL